jgi:kinesin family protein 2/24
MNGGGRQGLRSSGATGVHHQRQYSDNFLDGATTGNRWLQSAGLQHLQSSAANPLQVRFYQFYHIVLI